MFRAKAVSLVPPPARLGPINAAIVCPLLNAHFRTGRIHVGAFAASRRSFHANQNAKAAAEMVAEALQSVPLEALGVVLRDCPGLLEQLGRAQMAAKGFDRSGEWVGVERAGESWTVAK